MDYSDYTELTETASDTRSDKEWDDVWNTDDRNRDTLHKIELGLALVAVVAALVLGRAGWLRMSAPSRRIIPSASDIHVRLPPPR